MHWFTDNVKAELVAPWTQVVLTLAAILCGGIIGLERERHEKPAGLRTMILVCLGSAVFTMTSYAFTATTGDSGRVAAQIVTGIGFLGAGAILHSKTTVSGMTTAAAIWMTAAIGLTVGAGFPVAGLSLSLMLSLILAGVRRWEIRRLGGVKSVRVEIVFDPDGGKTRIRLECIREEFHAHGQLVVEQGPGDGLMRARMDLHLPRRHLHEFLNEVVDVPAVREIREVSSATGKPPA